MNTSNIDNSPHEAIASLIPSTELKVVRITNFLPTHERDKLYEAICNAEEYFKGTRLHGKQIGATSFLPMKSAGKYGMHANPPGEAAYPLANRIMEQIPSLCKKLEVETFEIADIDLTFINGLNGHSGNPHTDSGYQPYHISLIYYFHKVPKVFSGGKLQFYAFDVQAKDGHSEQSLFEIEPADNTLIAFPSETFHGITTVKSDSTNFSDGRFIAVGFV